MLEALEQLVFHRIAQSGEATLSGRVATVMNQSSGQVIGLRSVGESSSPSVYARTIVSQAWDEVGLVAPGRDGQKEDSSMFSCGADLVTTMLLSRCYQRRGHGLSMQDVIDNPTQDDQSRLLEIRKAQNGGADS
ncbi:hypothetical protein BDV96DRAFT_645921 [Lophiotrema nucula]|uniref:Uncharacterized protein n=1 Tax=Lophiotrema nucula TaxID=690887 RepID=A0A6A5Z8W3_9PLEO|nr:hypothetical protein BDV96DRAFT_645921 [Lophiotrema nucula]